MTPEFLRKKMKQRKFNCPDENIIENTFFESIGLGLAIVMIDEGLASLWLNLMPDCQRAMNMNNLSKMCDSQALGNWNDRNGETIKFDSSGSMVDGQHRLSMVVRTGRAIKCPVWYGCGTDSIASIDTGKSRSLADVLKIHGFGNANSAASVISNIISYEKYGKTSSQAPCVSSGLEFARNNTSELYRCVKFGAKARPYVTTSVAGMLYYFYRKVDKAGTDQMFGEFKNSTGRCNAIDSLKNIMVKVNSANSKMTSLWKMCISIKAFNKYFSGDDIGTLRWNRTEKIPTITDMFI